MEIASEVLALFFHAFSIESIKKTVMHAQSRWKVLRYAMRTRKVCMTNRDRWHRMKTVESLRLNVKKKVIIFLQIGSQSVN